MEPKYRQVEWTRWEKNESFTRLAGNGMVERVEGLNLLAEDGWELVSTVAFKSQGSLRILDTLSRNAD